MRTSHFVRASVIAIFLVTGWPDRSLSSQSLGEVARREAERREQLRSGRVYTNEDLAKVDPALPAPKVEQSPAATDETSSEPKPDLSGVGVQDNPATGGTNTNAPPAVGNRDENYWRRRSRDLRGRLAAVSANIAVTEGRLADLETKPPTPATARERELAAKALTQLQSERQLRHDDIAQLRTFAESQKVPPAWLELE